MKFIGDTEDALDGGKSRREAYPIATNNNSSGIDCEKTEEGSIALVCNPVQRGRTPLSILLSHDGGETFEKVLDFKTEKGKYYYPAVINSKNKLFATYTYNRKSIAYVETEL